jgi:hypothetical protein
MFSMTTKCPTIWDDRVTKSQLIFINTLNLGEVGILIIFIELRNGLILLPNLLRHIGEQIVDEVLHRFLWTSGDQFLVSLR